MSTDTKPAAVTLTVRYSRLRVAVERRGFRQDVHLPAWWDYTTRSYAWEAPFRL